MINWLVHNSASIFTFSLSLGCIGDQGSTASAAFAQPVWPALMTAHVAPRFQKCQCRHIIRGLFSSRRCVFCHFYFRSSIVYFRCAAVAQKSQTFWENAQRIPSTIGLNAHCSCSTKRLYFWQRPQPLIKWNFKNVVFVFFFKLSNKFKWKIYLKKFNEKKLIFYGLLVYIL